MRGETHDWQQYAQEGLPYMLQLTDWWWQSVRQGNLVHSPPVFLVRLWRHGSVRADVAVGSDLAAVDTPAAILSARAAGEARPQLLVHNSHVFGYMPRHNDPSRADPHLRSRHNDCFDLDWSTWISLAATGRSAFAVGKPAQAPHPDLTHAL